MKIVGAIIAACFCSALFAGGYVAIGEHEKIVGDWKVKKTARIQERRKAYRLRMIALRPTRTPAPEIVGSPTPTGTPTPTPTSQVIKVRGR